MQVNLLGRPPSFTTGGVYLSLDLRYEFHSKLQLTTQIIGTGDFL